MLNFKDWLTEELEGVTLHKTQEVDDPECKEHHYTANDKHGKNFAHIHVVHRKKPDGKFYNTASLIIKTNKDHPEFNKDKTTAMGPKYDVPHHEVKKAFHALAKQHPDVKHFSFVRKHPDSKWTFHKMDNPHYNGKE
jgi:hypothetical protein